MTRSTSDERPKDASTLRARPGGLLDIDHFVISREVLDFTLDKLAARGREGLEAFVLWGGRRLGEGLLDISNAIYPAQMAYRTDEGLLVVVDDESLFEVNKSLNERGEILAAQVHAHPVDAYHSTTDDALPIVTIVGGLSVVVPDFAVDGIGGLKYWAWYRLSETARWDPLSEHVRIQVT